MYLIPFTVGVGFGRLTGRTWGSSILYSGAVTWTAAQIKRGAFRRVASMGHRVLSLTGYQVLAGLAIGVGVGTATSSLLFGKEGREAAIDFYTDPFDSEKVETILDIPKNLMAITALNRAVENNAAGLPTGTNVSAQQTGQGMEPDYSHPNWQSGWWGEIPS